MTQQAIAGVEMIAAERRRQIAIEGWTPEHDAAHDRDESLAYAAAAYALPEQYRYYRERLDGSGLAPMFWPWEPCDWKPTPDDRVRELVKAGALIAAEIDRLHASPQRKLSGSIEEFSVTDHPNTTDEQNRREALAEIERREEPAADDRCRAKPPKVENPPPGPPSPPKWCTRPKGHDGDHEHRLFTGSGYRWAARALHPEESP